MAILDRVFGRCVILKEKRVGKITKRDYSRALEKFVAVMGALVFVLLITSIISPPNSQAAFPGANGKIAFISDRDGNIEIYVMNADGTNQTNLTNNPADDFSPTWSPDGTEIAFISTRDDPKGEIYKMKADGSDEARLTNNSSTDRNPAWSPDGTKIVFQTNGGDGGNNWNIWVMDADGNNQTPLTTGSPQKQEPTWSPSGSKIAFRAGPDPGGNQLYTMNPDGTGQTLLPSSPLPFNTYSPDWSPDGQKLAFAGSVPGSPIQIYVVNGDGSGGLTPLTTTGDNSEPVFSPDGTKIAFTGPPGAGEIYVMNADGSGQTNLTNNNSAYDAQASWQPAPVDTTAPTFNCAVAPTTWSASDVSRACTADNDGSGLATPANFSLTTNVPNGTETANALTGTAEVCDNAGNCVTAGPLDGNMVDKKAPVQTACDSPDGAWHPNNLTLNCAYRDGGAGPATQTVALTTNVPAGTEDANASASANGAQACDNVGNCAASPADVSGNMIDLKAPSVSCGSADANWHVDNQSVTCTATDGGSGPASQTLTLSTSVTPGDETDNAFTNSASICDAVNNCATVGPVGPFKIDKKGPTVTCTATPTYLLNQAGATVSASVTDGGSGSATSPVSAPVSTSAVGSYTAPVTGFDNVGNTTTANCAYTVNYNFSGFFPPVDNPGPGPAFVFNKAKAGSAIPVKFSLSGNQGLNIFAAGYPKAEKVDCNSAGSLADIEETVTAGGSSLNYDGTTDQYTYVWKTDKAWASTCRKLIVRLIDSTDHVAYFNFK